MTQVAWEEVASGLRFPEGPVPMPDGSVVFGEIARGTVSRLTAAGEVEVVADIGGGPNGCAVGPDGMLYVCDNGGSDFAEHNGLLTPQDQRADALGRIVKVDLDTGKVATLYDQCEGRPFSAPNDIVFDSTGGFWFTDMGGTRAGKRALGALHYGRADGSKVVRAMYPMETPNGVGLSPDGKAVYVAETIPARLWRFPLASPGVLEKASRRSTFVASRSDFALFDSLAVEADDVVCVATIIAGGITRMRPGMGVVDIVATPDPITTNIAFGGEDCQTAWATLSGTGKLVRGRWPAPGLALAHGGCA